MSWSLLTCTKSFVSRMSTPFLSIFILSTLSAICFSFTAKAILLYMSSCFVLRSLYLLTLGFSRPLFSKVSTRSSLCSSKLNCRLRNLAFCCFVSINSCLYCSFLSVRSLILYASISIFKWLIACAFSN